MPEGYDFCGWATKNDIRCADGKTIRRNAFKSCDGLKVPLVYGHNHNAVREVLGHALLENRDEGVYAYGYLNSTQAGQDARELLKHGDIVSLSIYANNLEMDRGSVLHGAIREVSLVPAGANPGAFIESVLVHSEPMDDLDTDGIIYTGEYITLAHADAKKEDKEDEPKKEESEESKEDKKDGKTVKDVFDTLNEDQKKAVAYVVGQAIQDTKKEKKSEEDEDKEKGGKEMKHNIFDQDERHGDVFLSHADQVQILDDAKSLGSLRAAIKKNIQEGGVLAHAIPTDGMETATGSSTYGFNDPEMLFPDYRDINGGAPQFLQRDQTWVTRVMGSVHHTPFSRIRSTFANITEDEARAKGYIKGKQKKTEVFSTLKRTTDPQTIYKLQKMDRDDVIDITDFNVIDWIRNEMRMMLNEEIARAILIGDGRLPDAEDKIKPVHIRPVVTDVDLFNTKVKISVSQSASKGEIAQATIDEVVRARKNYKGTGNPIFWTTEDVLTEMLLLKDGIGHPMYKTVQELATALRVSDIVTVEPMEGMEISVEGEEYPLIGTIVNLTDYNVGTNKGGEITWFEGFEIDYNRHEYLVETRMSGALTKPFSALTLVLDKGVSGMKINETAVKTSAKSKTEE